MQSSHFSTYPTANFNLGDALTKSGNIGDCLNNQFWKMKCIFIPEGVKELNLEYLFHPYSGIAEIFFPSTLESVTGRSAATSGQEIVFHCSSTEPENIKIIGYTNNNYSFFDGGIIYVPKGTTDKYKKSVFKKLTIIEDIPVEGVKFDYKNTTQYVGDTFTLNASVLPSDALNKEITYEISDSDVLAMTEDGTFEAKKFGTSKVYAYSKNKEYSDVCEVQVYDKTNGISLISSCSLKIGETFQLDGKTLPENTSDNIITYSSLDESIAKVDKNGLLFGVAKGTTTITASSKNGLYKAKCIVSVTQPATSVSLSEQNISLKVGEIKTLTATIAPSDADNKNIFWLSDDTNLVSVDNGKVTALKAGETYVRAISEDNQNIIDSCLIKVTQPVTGITLNHSGYTFEGIGSTLQLEAIIKPEDASNKEINWRSSNENICIVSNGKVVAVGFGTCVIIATSVDGAFMATCTVNVVQPVTGISLSHDTYTFTEIGKSIQLIATITPSDASNKDIVWESSNNAVCVVSNGIVVAQGFGTATISAESVDGHFRASCDIVVVQPVRGISLDYDNYTFNTIGQSASLTATVTPNDATNKEIIWESTNDNVCTVSDALVTAVGYGTAIVKAKSVDGGFTAECTIVVEEETGVISIQNSNTLTYKIYDISGKEIPTFKKGINIIKFCNGSTIKHVK